MTDIETSIDSVAADACSNPLAADAFGEILDDLQEMLYAGVPPIQAGAKGVGTWEIVAAAWLCELSRRGDNSDVITAVCSDAELNDFLIKSVELAGIQRTWAT
jgi:hypothetical protein